MLIVEVKKGENFDKALKRFKRKFEQTKVLREVRSRSQFEKPSVKKRKQKIKAKYKQKLRSEWENI